MFIVYKDVYMYELMMLYDELVLLWKKKSGVNGVDCFIVIASVVG